MFVSTDGQLKGTEMSEDESIAFPFYITFEDHHSRVLVDELVCCQETFPPKCIDSSMQSPSSPLEIM